MVNYITLGLKQNLHKVQGTIIQIRRFLFYVLLKFYIVALWQLGPKIINLIGA